MVEEKKEVQEEPKQESQEEQHSDLEKLDVKDLVSIIKETRAEAKKYRLAKKESQTELDKFKSKETREKEDELKKKGEYETLLAEKNAEIEKLKPKAEQFEELRTLKLESVKKELGDNWMDEYSSLSLAALEKLGGAITSKIKKAIDTDTGVSGKKEFENVDLTEKDKDDAIIMFPFLDKEKAYESYKELKVHKLKLKKKE